MGSINAQVFARKVSDTVRKGEIVNRRKLAIEAGYSPSTAARTHQITRTKSYQIAFALENKEIVDKIDRDIARIQEAMASKNLKKEEFKTLVGSMDVLVKNKQLLSGGSTSNVAIKVAVSEHILGKYDNMGKDDTSKSAENGST